MAKRTHIRSSCDPFIDIESIAASLLLSFSRCLSARISRSSGSKDSSASSRFARCRSRFAFSLSEHERPRSRDAKENSLAAILLLRRERQLSRMRESFVASISHELRTPLAQIRLFAETMLLGRVRSEEESRKSLEVIDQVTTTVTTPGSIPWTKS